MRKHQINRLLSNPSSPRKLVHMHWWCMAYARRILNASTEIERVMLVENARKLRPHWTRKIDLYLHAAKSANLHRYYRN